MSGKGERRLPRRIPTTAAAALALAVLSGGEAAVAATPACVDPARVFPGVRLGSWYSEVKRSVPALSRCARENQDLCEFVDAYGVRNTFDPFEETEYDRLDRRLTGKQPLREKKGWLPFGVTWSDNYRTVLAKLRPHGGRPKGGSRSLGIPSCGPAEAGGGLSFSFGLDGRLEFVWASAGAWP